MVRYSLKCKIYFCFMLTFLYIVDGCFNQTFSFYILLFNNHSWSFLLSQPYFGSHHWSFQRYRRERKGVRSRENGRKDIRVLEDEILKVYEKTSFKVRCIHTEEGNDKVTYRKTNVGRIKVRKGQLCCCEYKSHVWKRRH